MRFRISIREKCGALAEREIGHPDADKDAAYVARLGRGDTPGGRTTASDLNQTTLQCALDAFLDANSSDEMRYAVARFPVLADPIFIAFIEQTIAARVPRERRQAYEQRLACLWQIANEQ